MPETQRCAACKRPLSRYNPDPLCSSCLRAARYGPDGAERRRPPDRDRVQADDQPEAFHLAGHADHGGQDPAASPSIMASQKNQLSAITRGSPPRPVGDGPDLAGIPETARVEQFPGRRLGRRQAAVVQHGQLAGFQHTYHSSGPHWLRIDPGSHGHADRSPRSSCLSRG